ncbi:GHKL domain-containing protein [Sphingobacterium psychroaquaticum]|uniref:sensor histidine kinase n=1 Tax=Sphingobacterium psychroaquaticum TaxID=561061 RepID=UPI00106CD7A8|nr:ATP-binding protein [Sphingobacterium psychroaquaticum]QBQ40856.1 GHKL domain-containing protein [Sphingobacterium psychroaquaticum]
MNQRKDAIAIVWRIAVLLAVLFFGMWFFQKELQYTGAVLLLIGGALIYELYTYVRSHFMRIDKIVSALLYDDYSMDLGADTGKQGAMENAVRLYEKIRTKEAASVSQKMIYDQLLNGIDSGILIVKNPEGDMEITLMNTFVTNYFDIPTTSNWAFLRKRIANFCSVFETRNFTEFKTTIDIQVDKEERQTFVIQTSRSLLQGQVYYIILMDSIQRVIDVKQNEAWLSIMKVIAHELMNSLTPIHSLANNMKAILEQDDLSVEDKADLAMSLETIVNRSDHLQEFVDRYRRLTMLPTPVLKHVHLAEMVQGVVRNYRALLAQQNIQVLLHLDEGLHAAADRSQFEQVLINLLTNSVYAVSASENPTITIDLYQENKRIYCVFSDNAPLIDSTIIDKIFLPFYTTRKEGAGIGLSLSKSIIKAHNGYLYYQEKNGRNCFVIALLL